jgi:hypothetical protein
MTRRKCVATECVWTENKKYNVQISFFSPRTYTIKKIHYQKNLIEFFFLSSHIPTSHLDIHTLLALFVPALHNASETKYQAACVRRTPRDTQ